MAFFNFKFDKNRFKKAFNLKKMIVTAIAAIVIHELILPLLSIPGGWKIVVSVFGAVYLAELLD